MKRKLPSGIEEAHEAPSLCRAPKALLQDKNIQELTFMFPEPSLLLSLQVHHGSRAHGCPDPGRGHVCK